MFRNILVSVDASAEEEQALEQAIDLAESEHSRLTILIAVPRPPSWAMTPVTAAAIEPLGADVAQGAEDGCAGRSSASPVTCR